MAEIEQKFIVPSSIVAGTTVTFDVGAGQYSTSEYSMTFNLAGASRISVPATVLDQQTFRFTIAPSVTASLPPGRYWYQIVAEKGGDKYTVLEGELVLEANLASAPQPYDGRSQAEIIVEAIDAVMAKKATLDQQMYQIGNRHLARIPPAELLKLREYYSRIVARERRDERLRKGLPVIKTVEASFRRF